MSEEKIVCLASTPNFMQISPNLPVGWAKTELLWYTTFNRDRVTLTLARDCLYCVNIQYKGIFFGVKL